MSDLTRPGNPGNFNPELHAQLRSGTFHWGWFLWVIVVHVIAIYGCLKLFTWSAWHFGLISMIIFAYSMGIIHHMLLTHRSYNCSKGFEHGGSLLATLTWRGPFANPIRYVALHRVHHSFADTRSDPHSPLNGVVHALIGWFWRIPPLFRKSQHYEFLAPELAADPWHKYLDNHPHFIQLMWGIFCFLLGSLGPHALGAKGSFDLINGIRFTVFGVFVKTLLVLYIANTVDVINHKFGYRNYETDDRSTNSILMAAFHWGGAVSWHNNHHAEQSFFSVAKKPWEFDIHYYLLHFFQRLGLVSNIRRKIDLSP